MMLYTDLYQVFYSGLLFSNKFKQPNRII